MFTFFSGCDPQIILPDKVETKGKYLIEPWIQQTNNGLFFITLNISADKGNSLFFQNTPEIGNPPKALIEIQGQGKGVITINGNQRIQKDTLTTKSGPWEIFYNPKILPDQPTSNLPEDINIKWTNGIDIQEENIKITWSHPQEFFLDAQSISTIKDLVEKPKGKKWIDNSLSQETAKNWLKRMANLIQTQSLSYTGTISPKGWQQVKTREQILKTKQANCLDLCLYMASLLNDTNQGREKNTIKGYILVLTDHTIFGVKDDSMNKIIWIETTWLLKPNNTTPERAIDEGNKIAQNLKPNTYTILQTNF